MPQPYDTSAKYLLARYPAEWLTTLLAPGVADPVAPIETTLAMVNRQADQVLRVEASEPWLVHVELQANPDPRLDQRMLEYNILLGGQHGLAVRSVAILLRPLADRRGRSGVVRRELPGGQRYLDFRYTVVRLWEQPVEALLAGGLGTLPLAPLAAVPADAVPTVVRAVGERLNRETGTAEGDVLWLCTYILTGLRYAPETMLPVFEGVRAMQESATYQAILREGEARGEARGLVQGARLVLLWLGEARFGPPDARTRATIEAIGDVERIKALTQQLDRVASWPELLNR
jgi:predicted transposase YdaD